MLLDLFATDKLRKIYPRIREYIHEEIIPLEGKLLSSPDDEVERILREKREAIRAEGWMGLHMPEAGGGHGLGLMEFGQLSAVMAHTPYGHYVFNCQAPDAGNMELLLHHGTEEQKDRFLKPLVRGDIRSCFSMTEPMHAGSNPVIMSTLARKEGDEYVINGHKWFTSSADGAAFAIVMAVTDPDAHPYSRASMIIVPLDNPGYEFIRNIPVMGHAGSGFFSHAEVKYNDCRVPAANLIGKEGQGFMLAQERLGPGRIHHCMRWIGISERSLDMLCRRAAERRISEGRMLGHYQMIQQWIAESKAELDAARLMVLNTAKIIDEQGVKAASMEISTIKFYVANVMLRIVDRAIQAHGALGITEDIVLSFFYRHERAARIYDGPDEAHKASLARKILKHYGLNLKND